MKFQFHKGTIRTTDIQRQIQKVNYFNSIKVQLELKIIIKVALYALFQFHKGTIRTLDFFQLLDFHIHFNSIKVQLEHFPCNVERCHDVHFNSIKVQLELCDAACQRTLLVISIP